MGHARKALEALGHEVKLPPSEVMDENGRAIPAKEYYALKKKASIDERWIWERKGEEMRMHFDKVLWADAVLILNYDKNGIPHYIGANTLLEMGLAFITTRRSIF
ncbi:MAG: hypothetical protein HY459_03360 [Parcubacteria group bacterium]|nr:hypothetical protein [Parcubacteria group bacterium]